MRHQSPAAHVARVGAARRIRFARPHTRIACPRCGNLARLDPETNALLAHACPANDGSNKPRLVRA